MNSEASLSLHSADNLLQAGLDIARLRQLLREDRFCLQQRFMAHGKASLLLSSHSQLIDRYLRLVWQQLALPDSAALIAVGGYGREELFPRSDIDLLVLLAAEPDENQQHKLQQLIGLLWDIGLEVGHSIRTIQECLDESSDITVQTNLLEARYLCGNPALFSQLHHVLWQQLDPKQFFLAKQQEQQQRHLRFTDTDFNLEPNIKESPGGLRDLQNISWISHAAGLGTRWSELAKIGLITHNEARQIALHQGLLQNLRVRLHYLAKRREDRMIFEFQAALADQLGMEAETQRRASERLMKRYYRTKMAVLLFNRILLQNLRDFLFGEAAVQQNINERFKINGNALEIRAENLFETTPAAIFELLWLIPQYPELTELGTQALRALWRAKNQINAAFRRDPERRAQFMTLLRQPRGVLHNLRRMNQFGLLGAYLPAFARIVGQMQYDLFHVYTVDEHILMVVRNLRRFALPEYEHEAPFCSELMRDFARPEVLYIAGLFHDIAKGRGGDHSKLGKQDAYRFCVQHGIREDDRDLVVWLVEQHLTLSSTAQKQDLSDPDVIAGFASKIKNSRYLIALYLLTVADVRGTSPKIWNAWKAQLFENLYHSSRRYLRDGRVANQLGKIQEESTTLLNLLAIPPLNYRLLWAQLDESYFLDHSPQEVAWHTRLLSHQVNTSTPIVKARINRVVGAGIQVLVYCPDQRGLFARICAFFARMHYTIVEAKIHTAQHGYVVNSFQVMEAEQNQNTDYRDFMTYIEFELAQQISQASPLQGFSGGRVGRQLRHFPIATKATLQQDNKGQTTLFLSAGDRPGLLARLALILDQYNINLHRAKINTLGGRVEDVFWISGDTLNQAARVDSLLQEIQQKLQGNA